MIGLRELDAIFNQLLLSRNNTSLLKRSLTPRTFELLQDLETNNGTSLLDVIKSGIENPDSNIGVYAPDAEAYSTFALLFDPIIEKYHSIHLNTVGARPYSSLYGAGVSEFTKYASKYIVSTRIRACRSLLGFPLHGKIGRRGYQDVEARILNALSHSANRPSELVGTYYPLTAMKGIVSPSGSSSAVGKRVQIQTKGLWPQPITQDRYLCSAGAHTCYPTGRGVYINNAQDLALWINEEDHLRVMAVQKGADLEGVLSRFDKALMFLEHQTELEFIFDERLGYITFCPSNLGTTIRISTLIRLPNFMGKPKVLQELAKSYHLQIRGISGEHSSLENGGDVYDVSNARRLGLSEAEIIGEMVVGIEKLVRHT